MTNADGHKISWITLIWGFNREVVHYSSIQSKLWRESVNQEGARPVIKRSKEAELIPREAHIYFWITFGALQLKLDQYQAK